MTTERDRFLEQIRQAVADGNRAGGAPRCRSVAPSATRARAPIPSPAFAMNSPRPADSPTSSPTRPPPPKSSSACCANDPSAASFSAAAP